MTYPNSKASEKIETAEELAKALLALAETYRDTGPEGYISYAVIVDNLDILGFWNNASV